MSGGSDAGKQPSQSGSEQRGEESLPPGVQLRRGTSSPGISIHTNEGEEVVITSIRAIDVALGLRRIPAGFYAAVHHSDLEWRTENKCSSLHHDVVEWGGLIPIPSTLSAVVCLEIYASFEHQPVLGTGEKLRKLTVTVGRLLDRNADRVPFTFFPKDGEVVSPCSSVLVTVERRKCESNNSSASGVLQPHGSTAGPSSLLEDATNQGHSALLRYQKHAERRDLDCSIGEFERALAACPMDHPCRAAAQSNLAMAKFMLYRVENTHTHTSNEVPLRLLSDALGPRPVGHVDRPSTLIQLATVWLAQFNVSRDRIEGARVEALLHEAMKLSPAESHEKRAATVMLQLYATHRVDPMQPVGPPWVMQDSTSRLTDEDLQILSVRLLYCFERFGDLTDLQEAIAILKQSLRSTLVWDSWCYIGLTNLGSALARRFERLGEPSDLEEAISVLQNAVDLTPDGHSHKPTCLNAFSASLFARFNRFGKLNDLESTISMQRDAVVLLPDTDPDKITYLSNLGTTLRTRFEHLGKLGDLEEAISKLRDVVDMTAHGHLEESDRLNNLGACFYARFKHLGQLRDLEDAILRQRDAVDFTPHGHPHKRVHFNNLGNSLLARFERLGELGDLDDAILALRGAVDLVPYGHPDKPDHLSNLAVSFSIRFKRLGELRDLDDAIARESDAVDSTPHGHPHKSGYLNNLGNFLFIRFERFAETRDLENAILRRRDAVASAPLGHPDRLDYVNNLGNSLRARFEHLGELSDIEEAISTIKGTLDIIPNGHPRKPGYLHSLSASYYVRFQRLRELSDLDDAIRVLRAAIGLVPHDHPNRPGYLSPLGLYLQTRFINLGTLADLEDAISMLENAICLASRGHYDQVPILNNLGICLVARFERLGNSSDLDEAISTLTAAVNLTPRGHRAKAPRLSNLANCFVTRFSRLGDLNDLEAAISMLMEVVDLTPRVHADRSRRLVFLGESLVTRFNRLGELSDLENAISSYLFAACAPSGRVMDRFHASRCWIRCARRVNHRSLLHAFSVAINLLPQLAWVGLSLEHRYAELKHSADVVREAVAAALDAGFPETAVEWLEQGRSIVWGEQFRLRNSYDELAATHPDHARRLRELSVLLDVAGATRERSLSALGEQGERLFQEFDAGGQISSHDEKALSQHAHTFHRAQQSLRQEGDRHRALAVERDSLLQDVRRFPGFERFLLRKKFSHFRASARAGPVVMLNAAEGRCDALIVLAEVDHVIHVPLPKFTFKRSAGLQNMLQKLLGHARGVSSEERVGKSAASGGINWEALLSVLWDDVVKHVLGALAFSSPGELSRIFWCPTGPFVFLPIHAAGLYVAEYAQPGHKVSDFVVSSYVPTLSILASSLDSAMVPRNDLRLLAVRQPLSDGLSRLPGVVAELGHIRAAIMNYPSACATLLESSVGTVEEVLALMKEADWVHFACHGIQDAKDPASSGLCLADGRRLKLRDVIALSRPLGGLAFLSACQTAMGDEDLPDEAIHVAAGMLFAGYAGVVGTMWSISDKLAPEVARDVYALLFREGRPDHRGAARALHEAVGRVRESGRASFGAWIPFIHVGL